MAHPVTNALANVTDPTQRQAIKVAAFVALPNVVNVVGGGPTLKVRRSSAWTNGAVKIRRSGAWVAPTTVKVRRGGGWNTPT
jgi:hypothetical protein